MLCENGKNIPLKSLNAFLPSSFPATLTPNTFQIRFAHPSQADHTLGMTQFQHSVSCSWGHSMAAHEAGRDPRGVAGWCQPCTHSWKKLPQFQLCPSQQHREEQGPWSPLQCPMGRWIFTPKGDSKDKSPSTESNFSPRMTQVWHTPTRKSWNHLGSSRIRVQPVPTLSPAPSQGGIPLQYPRQR